MTWTMPSAVRFGSNVVPRSPKRSAAKPHGRSATVKPTHSAASTTPISVRLSSYRSRNAGASTGTAKAIAEKLGRTAAQVVLRWHLQLGNIVIPKSVTPARIAENLNVFGFELTDADLAELAKLERDERTGPHPDEFNVA